MISILPAISACRMPYLSISNHHYILPYKFVTKEKQQAV